jgi:hypothetical protein
MGYEQATTDLRTHFYNNWSATPISWPNASFSPPDPPDDFVKFNTQPGNSSKLEVGKSGLSEYPGVVFFGINVPAGQGRNGAMVHVDDLCDMYEFTNIGVVMVREAKVTNVGQSGDGVWYQVNCNFGYRWQERPN